MKWEKPSQLLRVFSGLAILGCLAVPLAAAAPGQADENVYTSKTHGFRIERPDAAWTFREELDAAGGSLAIILEPAGANGLIQVSVRVKPLGVPVEAEALRDRTLAYAEGRQEFSNRAARMFEIAGNKAPGLLIDQEARDQVFRVRQAYLVREGLQYVIQCHAPVKRFKSMAPAFDRIQESFELAPLSPELKADQKLKALAARCGSEIEWAETWEDAARRARKERKLVLVLVRFLSSFNISDQAAIGPLMDPDVVDLLRERFVALRLQKGMDAPFVAQESYGLGPSTFGTSFLLTTHRGEVVGDTCWLEASSFHDFLLEHLSRHPKLDGATSSRGLSGADLAGWHLRRGEYEEAAKLLESTETPQEHRLKASLLRRLRKGEEALEELKMARASGQEEWEAELAVDEAVNLLRMGRYPEAARVLSRVLEEHPDSPRIPEAMYWSGACKLRLEGTDAAAPVWKKLAAEHEENRWVWKAAAMLKSTAFALGAGERLDWPDEDLLAALRFPEYQALKASRVREAEDGAIAYLLSRQGPDGSWSSPSEVHRFSKERTNEFTQAVTSICAQGLLPHRERPEVRDAVMQAVEFLIRDREKEKAEKPLLYFMDYKVWSMAYRLWFLSDAVEAGLVAREKVEALMGEMVSGLEERQKPGGGWSYYITTELGSAGRPSNQSISFVTAAVLIALLEAREAGVSVPEAMTDAALGCLERMRNPNETFEYFLFHDQEDLPRSTPPPGAAGRGPLCTLALNLGGRVDLEAVERALDLFMEHRHTYSKEKGKTLMHTGLHAQGSHYLMFDYAFAAAAVRLLPKTRQSRYRKALLDQILDARSVDGSFIDNPLNGWHYGTGMALRAFQELRRQP